MSGIEKQQPVNSNWLVVGGSIQEGISMKHYDLDSKKEATDGH